MQGVLGGLGFLINSLFCCETKAVVVFWEYRSWESLEFGNPFCIEDWKMYISLTKIFVLNYFVRFS